MASSKPQRTAMVTYRHRTRQEIQKCPQHPDQNVNAYCDTCEQLVCGVCSLLGHGKHSLIDLSEAVDKFKQDVAELAAKLEMNKAELKIAMIETVKSRKKLDVMFAETTKKISQKADREVANIRQEEQNLQQEAERVYRERVKEFETAQAANSEGISEADNKLHSVNQFMDQSSCFEIQHCKRKLLQTLQKLTKKRPKKVPKKLSFIDFQEGEGPLGRLVLQEVLMSELQAAMSSMSVSPIRSHPKEEWRLYTQIHEKIVIHVDREIEFKLAHHAAMFSNSDVVTADNYYLVESSFRYSHRDYISKVSSIAKNSQCKFVSVNNDDQLIVLNQNRVHVFNREYKALHDFWLDKEPTCLAVSDNSLIAMGYEDRGQINLLSPDGSVINTLPAHLINSHLTIYEQRFIYTNLENKKLLAVDYSGNTVLSVDVPCKESWWGPTAVCCNTNGDIYVGVCGKWPSPGEIQHFSPNGQYLGCIIKRCSTPLDMKFRTVKSQEDKLVVAAGDCVNIFIRV